MFVEMNLANVVYSRDGDDLVLAAPDGATTTISGYFAQAVLEDLEGLHGAMLPGSVVASLATPPEAALDLGAPIGVVEFVEGAATATLPGGNVIALYAGDAVFQDTLIESHGSGSVGIELLDGSTVNVSSNGRLLLDDFVYDAATQSGTSAMTVLRGVMATATGEIGANNPENVDLRSLVGTIGIRGTTLVIEVDGLGEVEITVVEGSVVVTLFNGDIFELDEEGEFVSVDSLGNATVVAGGDERIAQLIQDTGFMAALDRIRNELDGSGLAPPPSDNGMVPGSTGETDVEPPAQPPADPNSATGPNTDSPTTETTTEPGQQAAQTEGAQPPATVLLVNAAPVFASESYTFSIDENLSGDAVIVGVVEATDNELDPLTFSLVEEDGPGGLWQIDETSGELRYAGPGEDFESDTTAYTLTVRVSDGGLHADATVTVSVNNVNDNAPVWEQGSYSFSLAENASGASAPIDLGNVGADDADGDSIRFAIAGGGGGFAIDSLTGALQYVGAGEDYESVSSRTFTLEASDGEFVGTAEVTVNIRNENDNAPVFGQGGYTFSLEENADGSASAIAVGAVGASDLEGDSLSYAIAGGSDAFVIDAGTGAISYVGSGEDHESVQALGLSVEVSDGDFTGTASVTVEIVNVNDNAPVFASERYSFDIDENVSGSPSPVTLGFASASDAEGDPLSYSIVGGGGAFAIDAASGAISYVGPGEDHEAAQSYSFTIEASDGDFADTAEVEVEVNNVNDIEPAFDEQSYTFSLEENADGSIAAISLGNVGASDGEGDTLSYSIIAGNDDGNFEIDASSGALSYVGSGEDHEQSPLLRLAVQVSDGDFTDTAEVEIEVSNVNDVAPVFGEPSYTFSLDENQPGEVAPLAIGNVSASDGDGDSLRYSITAGNGDGKFAIDAATGAIRYVGPGEDHESAPQSFSLTVEASDGTLTGTASVTVNVADVNEPPVFTSPDTFSVNEAFAPATTPAGIAAADPDPGATPIYTIGTVVAADPDAGHEVQYSIEGGADAAAVYIDPDTGELAFSTAAPDYETKTTYSFTVKAVGGSDGSDAIESFQDITVNVLDVNEYSPVFNSANFDRLQLEYLADGGVTLYIAPGSGPTYQVINRFTATDGDGSAVLVFTEVGGDTQLLDLAEDGSFTYAGPGYDDGDTISVTLQVSDGANSDQATLSIAVKGAIPAHDSDTPEFVKNEYDFSLQENEDGSGTPVAIGAVLAAIGAAGTVVYSISAGNDDGKFAIDSATGAISYSGSGEDYESVQSRGLTVRAELATDPGKSDQATVNIAITNVNDADPAFSQPGGYTFQLDENEAGDVTAIVIGTVSATDDGGGELIYSIASGDPAGKFAIGSSDGVITYQGSGEDYESAQAITLTIKAEESGGGASPPSSTTPVTVQIQNLNDNAPVFGQPDGYFFNPSTLGDGSTNPISIGTVSASDADGDSLTYSIGANGGLFSISPTSGEISYIGTGELVGWAITMTVLVSDGLSGNNKTVQIEVRVGSGSEPSSLSGSVLTITDADPEAAAPEPQPPFHIDDLQGGFPSPDDARPAGSLSRSELVAESREPGRGADRSAFDDIGLLPQDALAQGGYVAHADPASSPVGAADLGM